MKVKELIEQLQKEDPDAEAVYWSDQREGDRYEAVDGLRLVYVRLDVAGNAEDYSNTPRGDLKPAIAIE